MKNLFIPITTILIFLIFSCDDNDPQPENLTLIDLQISVDLDTLLIIGGNEKNIPVKGIYIKVDNNTITNKGGITITGYTVVNTDTVMKDMDESSLNWYSSNDTVASVTNGIIQTSIYGGLTAITASADSIISNTIYVIVSSGEPLLTIDPPMSQIVFQSIGNISGWVVGSDFSLEINSNSIEYSTEGRFNESVTLSVGENLFNIKATNNDQLALSTTKTKKIINLSFDDITGNWKGETLTRPFSFDIYQLVNQYVIDGTLTIDLTFMGGPLIIEDIIVFGLINSDGTINAELSKTADDMSISGLLVGSFSTSGVASGNYTLTIELLGTSLAHTEEWTAEKQ